MESEALEKFYLLLHPRPAYVIGSGRVGEAINFMAASWVSPIAEEPPRVGVAIGVESYTHDLINKYGSFTINILPTDMLDVLYFLGSVSGRSVDKASKAGLKIGKGQVTETPVIEDGLAFMECKVTSRLKSEDTTFFVGDVVGLKILRHDLFSMDKGWDFSKVNIPLHNWGRGFYTVGKFRIARKT